MSLKIYRLVDMTEIIVAISNNSYIKPCLRYTLEMPDYAAIRPSMRATKLVTSVKRLLSTRIRMNYCECM